MKKKVLVFPCGSEIGLEIHNALKFSTHVELVGGSSVSDHGRFVYERYIEGIPFVDNTDFIETINKIIDKHQIDAIYPAHDSVVLRLAKAYQEGKLNCKVIGSEFPTCQVCRSKKLTYETFSKILEIPKVYNLWDEDIQFPVFLKPDVGQGSKGTHIANNREELEFYFKQDPSLLILELLTGSEYTVDCFTDRHGELLTVCGRERIRTSNGISVHTKPTSISFDEVATIINKKLNLRGAWFFQMKYNKNCKLSLLEIAPRIAGTMGLFRNLGINFPLLSVFDAFDIDVSIKRNSYDIELDRALISRYELNLSYSKVYIDLDDTILLRSKVNTMVTAFLYQCVNENKSIYLITKNEGNIEDYLVEHKINPKLFDKIFAIHKEDRKSRFIKGNSIFIDDSFAERKEVQDALGIPVFDTNAIESLINWKF